MKKEPHTATYAPTPSCPSTKDVNCVPLHQTPAIMAVYAANVMSALPVLRGVHGVTGRRRLGVSAAVPRGALTAGQGQWLGVVVSPLHDVLLSAQLRLSLAQHGSPMYGGSMGYAGDIRSRPLP